MANTDRIVPVGNFLFKNNFGIYTVGERHRDKNAKLLKVLR